MKSTSSIIGILKQSLLLRVQWSVFEQYSLPIYQLFLVRTELTLKIFPFLDIVIVLRGEGTVSFRDYSGRSHDDCDSDASHGSDDCPNEEQILFTSNDILLDQQQHLRDDANLDPGEHSMPFSLTLPINCTSSFHGSHGSIRYYLMLMILNEKHNKNVFKHDINVERTYDLNLNPNNRVSKATH